MVKIFKRTYKRRGYKLKKRTYRRKGARSNTYKTSIQKSLAFSKSQIVKLRYIQQVQLNPAATAGSVAWIYYSANSINSPNIGQSPNVSYSASHQPLGHDQWSTVYNHYLVLGSKMSVQLIPNNSVSPFLAGGLATLMLQDTATSIIVASTVMESGRATYKNIAPNGTGPYRLRKSCSVKKFFNVRNLKDNIDNYGSLFGSNPAEQAYYNLQFFPTDTTVTGVLGPMCLVTIDYVVLMTGPKDLSQS